MRRTVSLFILAAFGLVAVGCTPTPEETCKRLETLAEGKKDFKLSMNKCLKNMNEMKERDPSAYKCAAKLTKKLDDLDTAMLGISMCDSNKPKKKDKSDGDDESDKKKKKSDDD